MPEQDTQVIEKPTAIAAQLQAATDSAVASIAGGGFSDPDFDRSIQEAIDKDAGKAPEAPEKPESKVVPAAEKAAAKTAVTPEIADDIPPELLGEKKPDKAAEKAPDEAAAEAERQKFIEEQTKGMTPKAAERFKKIESRAAEAESRAKKIEAERSSDKTAFQKQLEELNLKVSAKAADGGDSERLKKQVEELEGIIQKSNLQEDPRFKAHYDGGIAAEIEKLSKAVPAENSEELAQLAALPESKKRNERIMEITEGLTDLQKVKVLSSIERVDRLASEKADQLSKWKENKIHLEAAEIKKREEASANHDEIRKVAWVKGMTVVSSPESGLEVFRKADGNDEWNSKVDSRVAEVQRILTTSNAPEKLVEIAARAVASEDYRRMFMAQRLLVQKLSSELAELKQAEPDASGGNDSPNTVEDKDDYVTASVKAAAKAGALR